MTKNRLGLTAVALTLVGGSLAAFSYGCSDEDDGTPATTVDSGTDTGAKPDSSNNVDLPNCGHCINAFSTACRTKPYCQYNDVGGGKSTTALLLELNRCTCVEQCATECGQTCQGQGDVPPECATCNATKCAALFGACLGDTNPNDPACNNPFAGQPDGGSDGGDGGDGGESDAGDGG